MALLQELGKIGMEKIFPGSRDRFTGWRFNRARLSGVGCKRKRSIRFLG
jgi:hypothetical protein